MGYPRYADGAGHIGGTIVQGRLTQLLSIFFVLGVGLILLAACTDDATPTRPVYPTDTHIATPVPLILTPIVTERPLPGLPPMPNAQSSKILAQRGSRLVTVNSESDSITLLKDGIVQAEIIVGDDPRSVAMTPDGKTAWVTLRGENAVAVVNLETTQREAIIPIGHMPYGVVVDERRAYITCFGDGQVVVVDLASQTILYQIKVPEFPTGLALSGEWLLISHFYTGQVTALNVQRTPVMLGTVTADVGGTIAQSLILTPDGTRAYLPMTRTGLSLISLQYMQDWFPIVAILDLATMQADRDGRVALSSVEGSNMPFDAAFTADGKFLLVVLAGSDAVLVVDSATGRIQWRIEVGANPRGILIQGNQAVVSNALDGTLSVIDLDTYAVTNSITVTEIPLSPELLRGAVLFNSAEWPVMSDGAVSCATCHFDGGCDQRTWINFRSGPRNTLALGGAADLPPYNWAGEMAELQDSIEDHIRMVMLGDGLVGGDFDPLIDNIDAGRSADLDALVAYVSTFKAWQSPYRNPDGTLTESAQRGMQIFMSGSPGCSCHLPPLYTDQQQHDLANTTFSLEEYGAFDTPSLYGLWATAPYLHDGVVMTLEELLTRTDPTHSVADQLTPQQLIDLIAFLQSL
ncbi:MAG: hypothetical protein HND46_10170 [Chloroflexi bacterium]|nr:hypothetical protein [Chloroflexota bacterium]NOG63775.1 hypothetical protein [Chloroflexota bacterium]